MLAKSFDLIKRKGKNRLHGSPPQRTRAWSQKQNTPPPPLHSSLLILCLALKYTHASHFVRILLYCSTEHTNTDNSKLWSVIWTIQGPGFNLGLWGQRLQIHIPNRSRDVNIITLKSPSLVCPSRTTL